MPTTDPTPTADHAGHVCLSAEFGAVMTPLENQIAEHWFRVAKQMNSQEFVFDSGYGLMDRMSFG